MKGVDFMVWYWNAMPKSITIAVESQSISRAQLSQRWSCSVETLKRREKTGRLRAWKNGRLVRYRMPDVLDYEAQGSIVADRLSKGQEGGAL